MNPSGLIVTVLLLQSARRRVHGLQLARVRARRTRGCRCRRSQVRQRYWSRCEEEHRFPDDVFRDLGNGGWLGLCVPEEYGGGGQGLLELAVANETLCASGGTQGTFIYITTPGFGAMTLARHGTAEQKQRILPGIASGDIQFCLP